MSELIKKVTAEDAFGNFEEVPPEAYDALFGEGFYERMKEASKQVVRGTEVVTHIDTSIVTLGPPR